MKLAKGRKGNAIWHFAVGYREATTPRDRRIDVKTGGREWKRKLLIQGLKERKII